MVHSGDILGCTLLLSRVDVSHKHVQASDASLYLISLNVQHALWSCFPSRTTSRVFGSCNRQLSVGLWRSSADMTDDFIEGQILHFNEQNSRKDQACAHLSNT